MPAAYCGTHKLENGSGITMYIQGSRKDNFRHILFFFSRSTACFFYFVLHSFHKQWSGDGVCDVVCMLALVHKYLTPFHLFEQLFKKSCLNIKLIDFFFKKTFMSLFGSERFPGVTIYRFIFKFP